MITEDDIEVFIGKEEIRCTLRVSIAKHYSMHGVPTHDHDKYRMVMIAHMKKDIMREIYGDQSPTGYKSTPYAGP